MWKPNNDIYGIFPMIVGSLYVTAGAIIVGVPIGILTAVFMAFYCPKQIYKPLKTATELLAGIPSVVYGFFGLVVLVPIIRQLGRDLGFGGNGSSMLTASILLGIMILPTIIGVSESALRSVPRTYYEGALALGATHERSIFSHCAPCCQIRCHCRRGIGIGRAIGETMAVVMIAGNQPRMPGYPPGCPHHDRQYCTGNGLCSRPAQGSADCNRRCSLCVQFLLINFSVALLNRRGSHE